MTARIYTKESLNEAVAKSDSMSEAILLLGKKPTGGLHTYLSGLVKKYEIDTSHFTYTRKNAKLSNYKRKPAENILVLATDPMSRRVPSHLLTRALLEKGVSYECNECGTSEWQGKSLTLDVDHIDGNNLDCRENNLRFLCPNCHRQTVTFSRSKYSLTDEAKAAKKCECGQPKQKRSQRCAICYATQRYGIPATRQSSSTCLDCPKKTTGKSLRCEECYHASTKGKLKPASTNKILWPSEEKLLARLRASNYSALGRELNVSDKAIRKRIITMGYDPKTLLKLEVATAPDAAEVPAHVLALELA